MTPCSTLQRLRIEPRPEFADILRDERFAASPGGKPDVAERINRAFDRLILQSGTQLSGAVVLRLCLLVALAFGGAVFVFWGNFLATGLATGASALVPIAELAVRRARRRTRLSEQFPALVEQLLRTARAGRTLEKSFEQIAARSPAPLGDDLRLALRRTQLGLGLGDALGELPDDYRDVVMAHYHDDLGLQEIAQKFMVSESAVRSRLHRARVRLRAILNATPLGRELAADAA